MSVCLCLSFYHVHVFLSLSDFPLSVFLAPSLHPSASTPISIPPLRFASLKSQQGNRAVQKGVTLKTSSSGLPGQSGGRGAAGTAPGAATGYSPGLLALSPLPGAPLASAPRPSPTPDRLPPPLRKDRSRHRKGCLPEPGVGRRVESSHRW